MELSEQIDAEEISQDGNAAAAGYCAVLYVHGMGSQRRFEELSHLVDSLDQYAHGHMQEKGRLGNIKLRLEPSRGEQDRDVGYMNVLHHSPVQGYSQRKAFRFYECYWAPVTAEGVPYRSVATWILRSAVGPIRTLATKWRLRSRLRRAALLKKWQAIISNHPTAVDGDLKRLLKHYDKFEDWDARRDFPKGTRKEFRKYVAAKTDEGDRRKRMVKLALAWQRAYVAMELKNLWLLASLLLSVAVVAGTAIYVALVFLSWLAEWVSSTLPELPGSIEPTLANAAALAGALAVALGTTRFLHDYLGDVQFWTTYVETSEKHRKRREILDCSREAFLHVLNDVNCERVVVVAHSLGSTIALDTLSELSRRNRAASPRDAWAGPVPLTKISHFITFGSPIDRVHYFFESHSGKFHRYNRVVEVFRGDLGSMPFSRNGWPMMHWINFWSRADIISSALFSPADARQPAVQVDNVELPGPAIPNPGKAHTGYLEIERVVEVLFESVFEDRYRFPAFKDQQAPPTFQDKLVGPGLGRASTRVVHFVAMCLPWVIAYFAIRSALD